MGSWIAFLIFCQSLLQDRHFYFIKLSLTPSYSRKDYNLYIWFCEYLLQDHEQELIMIFQLILQYQQILFVRNDYNILITIFINFYNFSLYQHEKSLVRSCVFPKIFKLLFQIVCFLFYYEVVIIIWLIVQNSRNFVRHIKS